MNSFKILNSMCKYCLKWTWQWNASQELYDAKWCTGSVLSSLTEMSCICITRKVNPNIVGSDLTGDRFCFCLLQFIFFYDITTTVQLKTTIRKLSLAFPSLIFRNGVIQGSFAKNYTWKKKLWKSVLTLRINANCNKKWNYLLYPVTWSWSNRFPCVTS